MFPICSNGKKRVTVVCENANRRTIWCILLVILNGRKYSFQLFLCICTLKHSGNQS